MSKIILPIEVNPPIKSFLHHGFYNSIILARNDTIMPFLFNQYIQLVYRPYKRFIDEERLDYYFKWTDNFNDNLQYFDYEINYKDTLLINNISIVDYVRNMIKLAYYCILPVNEYHIPKKHIYHRGYFFHDLMVYGFDDSSEMFYILGYTYQNIYSATQASYSELENSFLDTKENGILTSVKTKEHIYTLDLRIITKLLEEYYLSINTYEKYRISNIWCLDEYYKNAKYGLDAVKSLKSFLDNVANGSFDPDKRVLYLLHEHKNFMLLRLKYLQDYNILKGIDNIIEEYSSVEKNALVAMKLFLKFYIKNDKEDIGKIKKYIDRIIESEESLLPLILEKLKEVVY